MDHLKIHTFGCKVNTYDSGLIEKNLKTFSHSDSHTQIHVLNTCAVTQEATKEAVKTVRRLKNKDPNCKVVITGCSAQVDTQSFDHLEGVDLVVANSHKSQLSDILNKYFRGEITDKVFKSNIFKKEDLEMGGGVESHHTRSFLKIQDGCNSFCTYCVIPYARGKSRSIPIEQLTQKIREIHIAGTQEVVLTGVHIGDYEDSNPTGNGIFVLEDLIESVLKTTSIPRIRLTSFEPVEISERLLDLFQDERLCPHFHMSIQSAQTQVLQDMKRKYTQLDVINSLERIALRVPKAFVGMDVIVGFPTESLEFFRETYNVLANTPWDKIHVFPYSERGGTRATLLEANVPVEERKRRSVELRELSQQRQIAKANLQLGSEKKVLILKNKEGLSFESLSRDYWPVHFVTSEQTADELQLLRDSRGKELDCTIDGIFQDEHQVSLKGKIKK